MELLENLKDDDQVRFIMRNGHWLEFDETWETKEDIVLVLNK